MRLWIVTSQPMVAAGLETALKGVPDIEAHTASPCDPALPDAIAAGNAEILLIDFAPEESFGLLLILRERFPACPMILWTRKLSAQIAYQALNLGVSGIVRTTESFEVLEQCLRAVGRGNTWFDERTKEGFFEAHLTGLTAREAHLIILIAQGLKNKEIAAASGISEATVRIYLSAIFRKLGVKDRHQLAIHGMRNLLIGPSLDGFQSEVWLGKRERSALFLESQSPLPAIAPQAERIGRRTPLAPCT
jgi:two-component system, NarL family, nitrate/nitrite response regulator NarL